MKENLTHVGGAGHITLAWLTMVGCAGPAFSQHRIVQPNVFSAENGPLPGVT